VIRGEIARRKGILNEYTNGAAIWLATVHAPTNASIGRNDGSAAAARRAGSACSAAAAGMAGSRQRATWNKLTKPAKPAVRKAIA